MGKENKLQEMQLIEQSLQSILYQKQAFQMELSETKSALHEMKNSGDEVFKIVGQLLIKTNKEKITKELEDKEKFLELRLKSIEKQEITLSEQLESLRDEIIKQEKK
jgi:prefoldin beta subunit